MSDILRKKYPENPDLRNERDKATFEVKELTTIVDQCEANTQERRHLENILLSDSQLPDIFELHNLNPDKLYKKLAKQSAHFIKKLDKLNLPNQVLGYNQFAESVYFRSLVSPNESPRSTHYLMFIKTLKLLASEEQEKRFDDLIASGEVSGTFSMTELGHGSNVKEIEVTATYDRKTEEFVIHSPTITAAKTWASGLGRTSNFAVVVAKLMLDGRNKGSHLFLVQLRNLDDHSVLSGLTIGEMGPKMGMLGTDNGFLKFDHFRIPRENMLMKHAKVLKDGSYVEPKSRHSNSWTVIYMRAVVMMYSTLSLAQGCVIAVRYNAIRRQGFIESGQPEVKIIDYQTQQYELFPQVALAYSLLFTFRKLVTHYTESLANENADLNEYYALTSGVKALSTHLCAEGIEKCRQACGGVGYLLASRLPDLYVNVLATCTFEGDNKVLRLQTARFLVKSIKSSQDEKKIGKRKNSKIVEYLELFEIATARMVKKVADQLEFDIANGKESAISLRDNSVELSKCGDFYIQTYILLCSHEILCETKMSDSLRDVMQDLFELLCVYWIQRDSGPFLMFGDVSKERIMEYDKRMLKLLDNLRPNMVSLVDAFDFSDVSLQSVIGCYDGRVYERLYDYWAKLPANKTQKNNIKSSL